MTFQKQALLQVSLGHDDSTGEFPCSDIMKLFIVKPYFEL